MFFFDFDCDVGGGAVPLCYEDDLEFDICLFLIVFLFVLFRRLCCSFRIVFF